MEKYNSDKKRFFLFIKRFFDITFSIICLVIGIPIIIIFSGLIVLESKGSPSYRQKRLGKNGKEFNIYKLRSMYINAEEYGPQWADKNDTRVTKIGKIIRSLRIDEIPQFYNVLKGDMSFVGPRPERKIFHDEFKKVIPDFDKRLKIKPGITGWAQINGGYDISPKEKLDLDLYYINNMGFKLDFKIVIKTFGVVFKRQGAR